MVAVRKQAAVVGMRLLDSQDGVYVRARPLPLPLPLAEMSPLAAVFHTVTVKTLHARRGAEAHMHVGARGAKIIRITPYQTVAVALGRGLTSEPWASVVDGRGSLAAEFEGIVTPQEPEAAGQRGLGG